MRASLLVLLLLASAASVAGQDASSRTPPSDHARMIGGGWLASAGTIALAAALEEPGVLGLAPLASGLVVHGVGESLSRDGSLGGAIGGAAAGALIGGGVIVASLSGQGDHLSGYLPGVVAGAVLYVFLPAVGGTIGYTLGGPTLLRAPDGEFAPGATLHLTL